MSENKMTKAPWRGQHDDNGYYYITAPNRPSPYIVATGGEGIVNEANTTAILNAVNGTYGIGVNPEAVGDLLETLKATLVLADKDLKDKFYKRSEECQAMYDRVVAAIKKAQL